MTKRVSLTAAVMMALALGSMVCRGVDDVRDAYARGVLSGAARPDVEFREVPDLGHDEAFRVTTKDGQFVVEYQTPAGMLYGAQAVIRGEFRPGEVATPDFLIRGTTLPMFRDGGYKATLSPRTFPWFYDRELMTRTLDTFAAARLNTIFLWGSHTFPYIVEMPEYPEASADVPPEQVKANQEQFLWFTKECEKRNIRVLLHFYNIHVSPPFARKHRIRTNPTTPTPLLREYTHYALSRYFDTFPSVGLYACPGESIHSKYQLEWFRDVIFDAAKKSDKNPVIVIRDWTLNHDFRDQLKSLYKNVYSELKHNDESLTSPYPDIRHMKWEGLAAGHIVNAAHGPAEDLVPMRWANPLFVREMAQHWKSLGFVTGVEFWGQSFWNWPYTYDKVDPPLLYLDRDAPFYEVVGRYLWDADRDRDAEETFWKDYHSQRFGSREVGELIARWYEVSGSIGSGLLNLNATRVANWWSAVVLKQQNVDQILTYNKRLDETPYTLHREAGRAHQRFYPRPFDDYFFQRYRAKHDLPVPGKTPDMFEEFGPYAGRMKVRALAQRKCMPVTQYAEYLVNNETVDMAMAPDKVVRLLHELAGEALALAEEAERTAGESSPHKAELQRFVTDSRIFKLATAAMRAKQDAAIMKACMLQRGEYGKDETDAFIAKMEESVELYRQLHDLGQACYSKASFRINWGSGLREFRSDLAGQKKWVAKQIAVTTGMTKHESLTDGGIRIEAEWMVGPAWEPGTKYPGFEGTGYAAPPKPGETSPLTARIKLDAEQTFKVSVRALKGGAHQDRALAVEIDGKRLKTTHRGDGPAAGAYSWEDAGAVTLPAGTHEIKLIPVGKAHPTPDVIMLTPADG